jgi:rhamnogalacturonan acetylesterase
MQLTSSLLFFTYGSGIFAATPKLLICSDSTTANYSLSSPLQGWGYHIGSYLTTPVVNLAKNGRSSRSFIAEGLWQKLLDQTSAGDFVLIEMGHNDESDPTKGKIPIIIYHPFSVDHLI